MAVSLEFRGAMLFRTEGDYAVEVLFPDTNRPPRESTDHKKHLDTSVANGHFAGMLVVNKSRAETHYDLTHTKVDFAPPANPERVPADYVKPFASLADAKATKLEFDQFSRPSARIDLQFGAKLSGDPAFTPVQPFKFASSNNVAIALRLVLDTPMLKVRLFRSSFSEPDEVVLNSDDTAYFYHYDCRRPSEVQLKEERTMTEDSFVDDDFRWLYGLVLPQNGTFKDWYNNGSSLPAPVWRRGIGPSGADPAITVSTCFPAWI